MKRTCDTNFNRMTAAMLIVLAMAAVVRADQITLRSEARITGTTVTLAEVAKLEGPAAEALAETPLLELTGERTTLTMRQAREMLEEHGTVHWGKVNLRGVMKTTIRRDRRTAEAEPISETRQTKSVDAMSAQVPGVRRADGPVAPAVPSPDSVGNLWANPLPDLATDGPAMVAQPAVRDLVRDHIESTYNRPVGEGLRITYRREDDPAWDITASEDRINLEPATPDLLGRVPFTVTVLRDGEVVEEHRVTVDVALQVEGLVATRRLRRDQTLTDRDVELDTRWIERAAGGLVDDPDRVVGKTVTRLVPEGELLSEADLAGAIVVRRGELIKARYLTGGLMLTVYCRAAEDGRLGDVIELRNTRNRQIYQARITGANEAVLRAGDDAPEGTGT